MKSEIADRGTGAGDVQRATSILAGGTEIGECRIADDSRGAGNIPAVGSIIIVEREIADGGTGAGNVTGTTTVAAVNAEIGERCVTDNSSGAVNIHLGLGGHGGCEHCSRENELGQSFHIFDIVVLASGHRTAFTYFIAIGYGVLTTF